MERPASSHFHAQRVNRRDEQCQRTSANGGGDRGGTARGVRREHHPHRFVSAEESCLSLPSVDAALLSSTRAECDDWYCIDTRRSWGDIKNGAIMSGSVGLACLFAFGLIRTVNKVYRTRALHSRVTTKPPPLPSFGAAFLVDWVARVVCVSEKTLYDTAGLDALYFDRANRLCLAISAFLALVNLGVVLPVNYHGTVISSVGATRVGGMSLMDKISMINVPAGSPLLWIHAAAVIVTVAFVSILLYQAFIDYREDRQSWLGHSVESAARAPLADEDDLAERRGTSEGADAPTDATEVSEGGGLTRRRTESVRRVDSMLRRGLSRHVLDHEQVEAANDRGSVVSEIHAPLSVFERQHVLLDSRRVQRRARLPTTRAVFEARVAHKVPHY